MVSNSVSEIGGLVIQKYFSPHGISILETGAPRVGGELRARAGEAAEYVAIEGKNLIDSPNDHFDLVAAASNVEHDAALWVGFIEMCRKTKQGGHIYLHAPASGSAQNDRHENPSFYRNSGTALAKWASSQSQGVRLVESFMTVRDDGLNDFVAVFRKGQTDIAMNYDFVHARTPCTDVVTWQTTDHRTEIAKERNALNLADTAEVERLSARLAHAEGVIARLIETKRLLGNQISQGELLLNEKVAQLDAGASRMSELAAEHAGLADRLTDTENTLRQRQEEIAQAWAELHAERAVEASLQSEVDRLVESVEQLASKLEDADSWVFKLAGDRRAAEKEVEVMVRRVAAERRLRMAAEHARERVEADLKSTAQFEREWEAKLEAAATVADARVAALSSEVAVARNEQSALTRKVGERFEEIAVLTQLLRREEEQAERQLQNTQWHCEVSRRLMDRPWWWGLMPLSWRRNRELEKLSLNGLFDGNAYLAKYPDVEQADINPLRHYILHGMAEGRSRCVSEANG